MLLGIICTLLGLIGIVLPGLPTTPFLLAASWLFYKSSARLRSCLLHSPLGQYIKNYERRRGVTRRGKMYAIITMIVMTLCSVIFFIDKAYLKIIVVCASLVGLMTIILFVPNAKNEEE
jgi:Uncharacterized protein conserved in bacteria